MTDLTFLVSLGAGIYIYIYSILFYTIYINLHLPFWEAFPNSNPKVLEEFFPQPPPKKKKKHFKDELRSNNANNAGSSLGYVGLLGHIQ